MTDTKLDLDRIQQAARDSLRFGVDRQVAQHRLDLVAEVSRLEEKQRVLDRKTVLESPTCDWDSAMQPDLNVIEEYARESLATSWERRLPQNCLDLAKEVRFWREFVCRHLSVVTACPGCDYEVEGDPLDLFRLSDKPKPHCLNCGCILSVRVQESGTDSGLIDAAIR